MTEILLISLYPLAPPHEFDHDIRTLPRRPKIHHNGVYSTAERNGGSTNAAARMLRRWRQRDSATSAAAWRRQSGLECSAKRGGGSANSAAQRLRQWR